MTNQKIFIAGHKGLVGASILTYLKKKGTEIITRDRNELDLLNQTQVQDFFKNEKIDQVYLAAAKVGGIYACNGILFNHESPVRGETFVTRKITRALARIKLGLQKTLYLGNLNAKRDWGHAKDYVEAQWLMLQKNKPEDFVIATGVQYSVRDFINLASKNLDMKIDWKGKGLDEVGSFDGKDIIKVDPRYFRPSEVETLLGDASKARDILNWIPKISFEELVKEMAEKDLKLEKKND